MKTESKPKMRWLRIFSNVFCELGKVLSFLDFFSSFGIR